MHHIASLKRFSDSDGIGHGSGRDWATVERGSSCRADPGLAGRGSGLVGRCASVAGGAAAAAASLTRVGDCVCVGIGVGSSIGLR